MMKQELMLFSFKNSILPIDHLKDKRNAITNKSPQVHEAFFYRSKISIIKLSANNKVK
jgi:hypothetical protein